MRQFYFAIFFTLITTLSFGQSIPTIQIGNTTKKSDQKKPTVWTWSKKDLGNNEYQLTFTADIDKGWVVYSMITDPDLGPTPTEIGYEEKTAGLKLGKVIESTVNRKKAYDKVFEGDVVKFKTQAVYTQKVTVTETYKGATLAGYIYFMTCNDEKCMPPSYIDFEFNFPAYKSAAVTPKPKENTGTVTPPKENTQVVEKPAVIEKPTKVEAPTTPTEPKALSSEATSWNVDAKKLSDTEYQIDFQASLKDGFYIYSQEKTGAKGPMPTTIKINGENTKFTVLESTETGYNKKEGADSYFKMNVVKYADAVTFSRKIKVKDAMQNLDGEITFIACNDKMCFPPQPIPFSVELPTEIYKAAASTAKAEALATNGEHTFDMTYAGMGCDDVEQVSKSSLSLFWIFIAGFGGGLVALLTPCVFPMLPLTVAFFTKQSKTKAKGITNAIIYGLSIIVIYVGLGLLVTGFFGADALNQLSTSTVMNLIFFALFVIFALSFFGLFEIQLPNSWANRSDEMADKGGLIGIFFMAFTLSLVSFSCTGPIIGTLLVEASNGGGPTLIGDYVPLRPLMGMFGFALALALPFTLFAAFPGWLNSLPKSGGWMNTVKISIGILELALALKFLSTADLVNHWGILPLELFLGAWIILFGILGLYLLGIIRFKSDGPKKGRLNPIRMVLGVGTLAFVGYLFTGFSYQPLSLLSGLAPPTHYNWFQDKSALEYPDCPNGIRCLKDYDEALTYAKEKDLPILIDFTGHGCVNCRKVEGTVWIEKDVRAIIEEDYVLVSLYVDERQKVDTYMSPYSGNKIRTVGNKWADFQEHFFQEQSQPLYVLVDTDGTVLHKPIGYAEAKDPADYIEFLQCGLNRRKSLKQQKEKEKLGQK